MGGSLFNEYHTVRLSRPDYEAFATALKLHLKDKFPQIPFIEPTPYFSKADFGDLDLLYTSISPDDLIQLFPNTPVVRNGITTSFCLPTLDQQHFQVDFIRIPFDQLYFAYAYFSYNDLGNLLGRVAHRLGFKLGFTGLQYVVRGLDNEHLVVAELTVTKSWAEALDVLRYSSKTWERGFATEEDIFRYVLTSGYVVKDMFALEQTNHSNRIRNRKRKLYSKFIEWVKEQNIPEKLVIPKTELRQQFLEKVCILFPAFEDQLKQARLKEEQLKRVRERFNGEIISELTGLSGKELGSFIQEFIHRVIEERDNSTKINWVAIHSKEEIISKIIQFKSQLDE